MTDHHDDHENRPRRLRRVVATLAGVIGTIIVLFALTSATGLPGPGALRRYPPADLNRVADKINHAAHNDSFAPCYGPEDIATVDPIKSRVVITKTMLPIALDKEQVPMIDGPNGDRVFAMIACDRE